MRPGGLRVAGALFRPVRAWRAAPRAGGRSLCFSRLMRVASSGSRMRAAPSAARHFPTLSTPLFSRTTPRECRPQTCRQHRGRFVRLEGQQSNPQAAPFTRSAFLLQTTGITSFARPPMLLRLNARGIERKLSVWRLVTGCVKEVRRQWRGAERAGEVGRRLPVLLPKVTRRSRRSDTNVAKDRKTGSLSAWHRLCQEEGRLGRKVRRDI